MAYGTLMTFDTLAVSLATVVQIGEDRVFDIFSARLQAHNDLLNEKLSQLVDFNNVRLWRWGDTTDMDMEEMDELGTPNAQKSSIQGQTAGAPLRLYGIGLQWTRKYFQNATGAEVARQIQAAQDADMRAIDREIRRALFNPTNYTFNDRLIDKVDLPVKALVNADGVILPLGQDGLVFNGAAHTHFLASVAVSATDLKNLIETVVEHYSAGDAVIYINRGNEAGVRGLAGFVPYPVDRIRYPDTTTLGVGNAPINSMYNRPIGVFESNGIEAEIWVKPWLPLNYYYAFLRGVRKTLRFRKRDGGGAGAGNLELVADEENHPLRARVLEREFGLAVQERTNGAILYGGGASYVTPVFTL